MHNKDSEGTRRRDIYDARSGARPTNGISIEVEIRSKYWAL